MSVAHVRRIETDAMTRKRVALAWLPAVLYMALIWTLSSFSTVPVDVEALPMRDKGVHFVEYAVLGVLVAHAVLRSSQTHSRPRAFLVALLVCGAWGMLDEFHQSFVPGRMSDVRDLVADVFGSSLGAALRVAFGAFVHAHKR